MNLNLDSPSLIIKRITLRTANNEHVTKGFILFVFMRSFLPRANFPLIITKHLMAVGNKSLATLFQLWLFVLVVLYPFQR